VIAKNAPLTVQLLCLPFSTMQGILPLVGCEGGYDLHRKANSVANEELEGVDATSGGSKGWGERENGKEVHKGWRNGRQRKAVEVAADAQRRV
jgi:hypothetical protein